MASFIRQIPGQVSSFIPPVFKMSSSGANSHTPQSQTLNQTQPQNQTHVQTQKPDRAISPERKPTTRPTSSPVSSRTSSPPHSSRTSSPLSASGSPPKFDVPPKPWIDKVYDAIECNNLRAYNKLLAEAPYSDYCINSEFYQSIIELTRFLIQRTVTTFLDRLDMKYPGVLNADLFLKNIVFTGSRNMVNWYLAKPGIKDNVSASLVSELASKLNWPETEMLGLIRLCFDQKNNKEYQEIAQILLDILFTNELLAVDGYIDAMAYTKLMRLAVNYPSTGKGGNNIKADTVVNTELAIWLTNYYNTRYPIITATAPESTIGVPTAENK